MFRPSFQRKIPPIAGSAWAHRCAKHRHHSAHQMHQKIARHSRAVLFQQRQRANNFGSNARFGTVPCHVSQSSVVVERSGGNGYSHAPHGELRPLEASMRHRSPMFPCAKNPWLLPREGRYAL